MSKHWTELVEEKRARQKESIPNEWLITVPPATVLDVTAIPEQCGLLSAKEIEITNTHVEGLLAKLAKAEWSALEVVTAFGKRAIIAHQLTNCLTEIFIDRAIARAKVLDQHLKTTGQVVGPLHGLPVSLKDQPNIKGLETTMGYVSWIGKYATRNAVLVDMLEDAGAVLFVRTNVPQTLMWPETFNNVFGRTTNPYNRKLTSGGSSGGEGALVALKGSPLGVGSDVGGSIRIPAASVGVYGLRPSYHRVPFALCVNSLEGQDSMPSVLGPLSNSIGGLLSFMRTVVAGKPWLKDPLAIKKTWDEDAYQLSEHGGRGANLCFAVCWDDGITRPHPPIIRGLEIAKKALVAAGHHVIDWKPLKHPEICRVCLHIWGAGSTDDYLATTSSTGEPILRSMADESSQSAGFPNHLPKSAYELWQVQKERTALRKEYLDHWEATVDQTGTGRPVDALLFPCASSAAPPHGTNANADYTMVWNGLDYAALTIPVSKVDQTLDVKRPPHEFYNAQDKAHYDAYDPSTYLNAPVSLQVVGRTLEEEAVLAMAEIVDGAIKASQGAHV